MTPSASISARYTILRRPPPWPISAHAGRSLLLPKKLSSCHNAFRESLQAVPEPSEKWTECWGHIYLGKVFDLLGQRERGVNEYSKAKQTNDDTGGCQLESERWLKKAYSEGRYLRR